MENALQMERSVWRVSALSWTHSMPTLTSRRAPSDSERNDEGEDP